MTSIYHQALLCCQRVRHRLLPEIAIDFAKIFDDDIESAKINFAVWNSLRCNVGLYEDDDEEKKINDDDIELNLENKYNMIIKNDYDDYLDVYIFLCGCILFVFVCIWFLQYLKNDTIKFPRLIKCYFMR